MDISGWTGSWIASLGLMADMAGVALLTLDLAPEFQLSRERQRFFNICRGLERQLGHATEDRVGTRPQHFQLAVAAVLPAIREGDADRILAIPDEMHAPITEALMWLPVGYREMLMKDLVKAADRFRAASGRMPWFKPTYWWMKPSDYDPDELWMRLRTAAELLRVTTTVVSERRRPPFSVAGVAIVLGFALQLLGQLPNLPWW